MPKLSNLFCLIKVELILKLLLEVRCSQILQIYIVFKNINCIRTCKSAKVLSTMEKVVDGCKAAKVKNISPPRTSIYFVDCGRGSPRTSKLTSRITVRVDDLNNTNLLLGITRVI